MSRKTLIICTCIALALLAVIALGVYSLYSDEGRARAAQKMKADTSLLAAIPSDAAAVMTFQDLKRGLPLLSMFSSGKFNSFLSESAESGPLSVSPIAASLHYSGSIVPLIVFASADSASYLRAVNGGLAARIVESEEKRLLLVSPSETIVSSSARHLGAGASILDNAVFAGLATVVSQRNAAYFSNDYADKLVSSYDNFFGKYSQFLKKTAEWTAIIPQGSSETSYAIKTAAGKDAACYVNVLEAIQPGTSRVGEVSPTNTIFALSLCFNGAERYRSAYQKYLDANQKLSQYRHSVDELRSRAGTSPEQWASDVREVASISWKLDDGTVLKANAVRKNNQSGAELEISDAYSYAGFAACEFGDLFALLSESCNVRIGDWMLSGDRAALEDLLSAIRQEETLTDILEEKDCAMQMYYTANDTKLLSYGKSGFDLDVATAVVKSNRTPELVVEVPKGPFEVTNSLTNKKNSFYQNAQLSLCLNDENGKGLWGVPFKQPICGYVSDVDYYNNGKIQFLFAAGSSLYMISRLGAFVQGFPVDLGKDILLGPAVYDFTGSKGYTVMVLHKDNTVEMYNLHGKKPEAWQGITADDVIVSMPELLTVSGQKYWKVQTTRETLFFAFNGGEQIKDRKILNSLK